MAVAVGALPLNKEALRHDQVQMILGARHRDIKQPPLLLDLGLRSGGKVRRNAAVDHIENEDRLPFLALGRMDGREDQIILVEQRRAGAVAGGVRRIEREFGQKAFAARIGRRRSAQAAGDRPGATSHRRECARDAARTSGRQHRARPASRPHAARMSRTASTKSGQCSAAAARRLDLVQRRHRVGAASASDRALCAAVAGPAPGSNCTTRKPATRSRGFSAQRSSDSRSLICAASRNFRPPNFTNGMLRRVSSTSSGPL